MRRQTSAEILFLIITFVGSTFAQTPKPPAIEDDGEIIKVNSRLVVVPVSVTDVAGQPVLGLKAQDFLVAEESKRQEISQVSDAEKVPLEIALLFDVSASTDAMFQFEQETAAKFLQEVMRPDDRATIFTIGERPILFQPRDTADKAAVSIKKIQPTKQYTAFYDTVKAASDYLQKNAAQGRRKVVVVISDGEDTNSEDVRRGFASVYSSLGKDINTITAAKLRNLLAGKRDDIRQKAQAKVLQSLQNADTVFYSINPSGGSIRLNQISQFGQSNLQKFADQTGGAAFLPKFQPISLKENVQNSYNLKFNQETLTKIFRQLANELQAQYLVQYYSDGNFPADKYVKLAVDLQNGQNLKVRARQGYFVKN